MKKDGLRNALENWDSIDRRKDAFIEKNRDPDDGDPKCGYAAWDEAITDFNYELAEAGEFLADAIREVLGDNES